MTASAGSAHPLDGAFERINRAGEHLAELEGLIVDLRKVHHDAIAIEFEPDPPYKINPTFQGIRRHPSFRLGILIGEICHNLRAALDYLIYELARRDGTVEDGTQFPLEMTPKKFRGRKDTFLKFVTDASHLALIEDAQPYNCAWSNALARISNSDKHRIIQVTTGVYIIGVRIGGKAGATIGTERSVRRATRPDGIEVDLYLTSSLDVGIPVETAPRRTEAKPAIDTLHEIKTEVTNLLEAFKPEF